MGVVGGLAAWVCVAGHAQAPITLEAHAGFGGHVEVGEWAPVAVIVDNRGAATEGDLVIPPQSATEDEHEYRVLIDVPPSSRRAFTLYLRCLVEANEVTVELRPQDGQKVRGEVQVIRLGDTALVGWPGEPFVELGLEIKRRAVAPASSVVGYANGYLGYFATPSAWDQGGYEVGNGPWARVGPAAGSVVIEKALGLIEELWIQ